MAIKGVSIKNKPILGRPTKVDLNWRNQTLKNGAEVWPVGSDTAKSTIYSRLKLSEPGVGFIHFHAGLQQEYFDQLTSEKLRTRYVRGYATREWVKKSGSRNEALDCFVYALAAMQSLYFRFNRKTIWDQLEKKLVKKRGLENMPALQKPPRNGNVGARSSFVTNW
jgi:phage terminase large subunit GpA-like protein